MVITVLKVTFTSKPKVIAYRDFKVFNEEKCKTDLKDSLRITNIPSYYVFDYFFLKSWGDMLWLKTKQSELTMHHTSQKLWEKQ